MKRNACLCQIQDAAQLLIMFWAGYSLLSGKNTMPKPYFDPEAHLPFGDINVIAPTGMNHNCKTYCTLQWALI